MSYDYSNGHPQGDHKTVRNSFTLENFGWHGGGSFPVLGSTLHQCPSVSISG